MRLPRDISPGAAARRSLLADLSIASVLALLAFELAAGIGIVAVVALPAILALTLWIGVEAALHRRGRRRARALSAQAKAARPKGPPAAASSHRRQGRGAI